MEKYKIILIIFALFSVGACSRLGDNPTQIVNEPLLANATASPISASDISGFIDEQAAPLLTEKELNEAASAQFYALQFGRVGAPRIWQGETGASGRVFVGPFVKVNNLNCRQFTHVVTIKNVTYEQKGTACREADGSWDVFDS